MLESPERLALLSADRWDLVLRQAISAGVVGRLGALAQAHGLIDRLDPSVARHLCVWHAVAQQQQRAVNWELHKLSADLADIEGPVLLLKGAAYAAAGLPPAPGRMFSDIDLMVPHAQLDAAEAALMLAGWATDRMSEYDLRYYREWTHELPPMRHLRRQTVLDLHHSILPTTARIKTRPDLILSAARPLPGFPRFSIPAPCDLVLHSATHLFHEGEWQHGLRDLVDIDALLRAFGSEPAFWDQLLDRAAALGLGRPLFHALQCCRRLLHTQIPSDLLQRCPDRPGRQAARLMERLFVAGLGAAHQSCRTAGTGAAEFALYVRSHWLRMPPHLLLPHLLYKAWQDHIEPLFEPKPEDQTVKP